MMTTADLPDDMRYDPDNATARAVRASGLTISCRHGDDVCTRCISTAAAAIVAAGAPSSPGSTR